MIGESEDHVCSSGLSGGPSPLLVALLPCPGLRGPLLRGLSPRRLVPFSLPPLLVLPRLPLPLLHQKAKPSVLVFLELLPVCAHPAVDHSLLVRPLSLGKVRPRVRSRPRALVLHRHGRQVLLELVLLREEIETGIRRRRRRRGVCRRGRPRAGLEGGPPAEGGARFRSSLCRPSAAHRRRRELGHVPAPLVPNAIARLLRLVSILHPLYV